jgi:hypothetical protein
VNENVVIAEVEATVNNLVVFGEGSIHTCGCGVGSIGGNESIVYIIPTVKLVAVVSLSSVSAVLILNDDTTVGCIGSNSKLSGIGAFNIEGLGCVSRN